MGKSLNRTIFGTVQVFQAMGSSPASAFFPFARDTRIITPAAMMSGHDNATYGSRSIAA